MTTPQLPSGISVLPDGGVIRFIRADGSRLGGWYEEGEGLVGGDMYATQADLDQFAREITGLSDAHWPDEDMNAPQGVIEAFEALESSLGSI